MNYDYDLIVIGAGSGGLAAAKKAAKLGKKVAIAEKNEIGGTCVNRGCVPTKLMVYAAGFAKQQSLASDYGWVNPEGLFDWPAFRQKMSEHIHSIRETQETNLDGVDILHGEAIFKDAHTLQISDTVVTSEYILIAVGARPRMPDLRGIDLAINSRDVFHLDTLPDSFIIVGGGYIGVEFSQILNSFGCRVTLVESSPHLLNGFDSDVQTRVQRILEDEGIQIIMGSPLESIEQNVGTLMATLDNGQTYKAQAILCSVGREANIHTLNLDAVGVKTERNKIPVNAQGQTQISTIFAVGDCTDRFLLTPVAKAEAEVAIDAMFCDRENEVNYRWVPSAVFMHPEVATVGLTEQEARKSHEEIEIHCDTFHPLKYSIASESLEAMIKLIINPQNGHIIGVHMVAPQAADLVQALVPALKKGLTKSELDATIGIHPSVGEEVFAL